ncbi:hypothetical protein CDES_01115 [Corynebacterium deserti GIMN1.010]|uniref:Uncharacterized protein n=1 Tax=Corynebacterium deserti GIMN1.010 TaxID=931089 RepID=A0A0M3Q8Z3_9CORY|nr:hypothetical protein [Corynebacterium deserti]ALC04703.1 hypothetical protein CDES_01115 [Corynebacterium deserti GIMN1.010]
MPTHYARDNVISLTSAREQRDAPKEPEPELTLIVRAINVQADGEVYRQIGLNSAMSLDELHQVLNIVFGMAGEKSPWRFEDQLRNLCDPAQPVGHYLECGGDVLIYYWGLWQINLHCLEMYPRDNGTPRALCIGGSGGFTGDFDQATINAELTGTDTIRDVLSRVRPEVIDLVDRTGVFDFIPLLQALDLKRETLIDATRHHTSRTLPVENSAEASDAFWSCVLALSCLGNDDLFTEVIESTMSTLGWVADDGSPLHAPEITSACEQSLRILADLGAYGPSKLAPVDRLDIYRELLRF